MSIRLRLTHKPYRGFTMIEMLVALAVTAAIVSGISIAIYQMFSINASASNRMLAINQVQNVGSYISKDAQMARTITPDDDPETDEVAEFVTLEWIDWDNNEYKVIYTLDGVSGDLEREYYVKLSGSDEYELMATTLIAGNMESAVEYTDCYFDADGRLIVLATATVGGFGQASETRIYEIIPRTGV